MTLFEALERISSDKYAETKSPGELAALIKPWLGNLTDRTPCADAAPLMLRMIADAPGWNRFDYRDGVFKMLAGAHCVLRAAESLSEETDLESSLNLIRLGRTICQETLQSSALASRRPMEQERKIGDLWKP
jgi:hypothetical protein